MGERNMGLSYDGEFTVGKVHLKMEGTKVMLRQEKVGATDVPEKKTKDNAGVKSGFGTNGEFRIGAITLAISDNNDIVRLRRENVGHQTETASTTFADLLDQLYFNDDKKGQPAEHGISDAALEGILESAFFTRFVEPNGNVTSNLARVLDGGA